MLRKLTALTAVLLILCIGCDNRYASSDKSQLHSLSREMVHSDSGSISNYLMPEEEKQKPEAPPENDFIAAAEEPLSTFSIDVDEAAYSYIRSYLQQGNLPPADAVRIEEFINYFDYEYPQPQQADPFYVFSEIAPCPWNMKHKLVHIGLQGKEVPMDNLPPSNLVFLVDVSGSMMNANKLPLVKESLSLLTDRLREIDKVSIVVYAGQAGKVLSPTSGSQKEKIKKAINDLQAGGSTAGGEGIVLAYKLAEENFIKDGNNRVILATDGDFNVGVSSDSELVKLIEEERKKGIFLSVLGYGMGNYQDEKMQQLADNGNGNHSYIDNINEAQKVLIREFGSTLFTIASDVKIQVEFNPVLVQSYRLIGYENRMLATEDFEDDKKDAGELGSGHTVTALYEIVPAGISPVYTKNREGAMKPDEVLRIQLRFKKPGEAKSELITVTTRNAETKMETTSENFRFSAAVAEFGLLLRNSKYSGDASYEQVLEMAGHATGKDPHGYRQEFISLVRKAKALTK